MNSLDKRRLKDLIHRYEEVFFTVYKKIASDIREHLGSHLTPDQHYILRCIKKYEPCTSTKLAELFFVNKGAITAIVDRLRLKGLVERVIDPRDRRVIVLKLTEKGYDIYAKGEEKVHQVVQSYLTQLDEREMVTFIETYEKLAAIVKRDG